MHLRHALGLAVRPTMCKPRTFQELTTKAHDMEVTIASRCGNSFYSTESRKDKVEFEKNVDFSKSTTKGAMSTFTSQPIHIMGKRKLEGRKSPSFKVATNKRPTELAKFVNTNFASKIY